MKEEISVQPVSQSLQHKFKELQERASKDALSGLLNRVTAEMYINQELAGMKSEDRCALFIIDLDNFKHINDTLGHQAGDQAIRQSARILSELFRATDIVGRLGGDEFIVFLCGKISEKLIYSKGTAICEHLQLILGGNPSVSMTASVGIHIASGPGESFDSLYHASDLALYKAKHNGKHGFFVKHGKTLSENSDAFYPVNTIPINGVLEQMDTGIALLQMGSPMQLIYISPSFCRIIGADPKTLILPRPLSSIIHPDDMEDLECALRTGLKQNKTVDHTHRVSADGKNWLWWHIRASKIEYNDPNAVMLVTATDVSRFKENEQRLEETNQRLQSAFEQTTQGMWEVDLSTREFTLFSYLDQESSRTPGKGIFPDVLINDGWIHPCSVPEFRKFSDELLNGKDEGNDCFVIRYRKTGCYGWAAFSYRRLRDEKEGNNRVVGIIEKFTKGFEEYRGSALSKRFIPEAITDYLIFGMEASLTDDRIIQLWNAGSPVSSSEYEQSCSDILFKEKNRIYDPENDSVLDNYFDRDFLLDNFKGNQVWTILKYRRSDPMRGLCRVNHIINLVRDPLSQEVYLFIYIIWADIHYQFESALGINVVRDPFTSLYDRATTRALIEAQLGKKEWKQCATAVVRLGGVKKLYIERTSSLQQRFRNLITAFTTALKPECIIGQYDRDDLLVFFPDISAQSDIKRQIEDAFSFVRITLADMPALNALRFVAGVVCMMPGQASYTSMTSRAVQLCETWSNAAVDTVVFSLEPDAWSELNQTGQGEQITIAQEELEYPLSEQAKDVAFQCFSSMLNSDSLDASVHSILDCVGNYYQADRTYLLALTENYHVITMPFEWNSPQKSSIQQTVSGLLVERFPILQRCIEERAPVFLTRPRSAQQNGDSAEEKQWRFTAFPLIQEDVIVGFLCIENPRKHVADAVLPATLIPYILKEQKRFHKKVQLAGYSSSVFLNGLPDLRSYINVISSITSDVYNSMGAVCLDIPELSTINSAQGFEYGSRMMWYISKTLTDIYGHSFIFRTWASEFIVLCPDITRSVFTGKYTRLYSNLQRRYPKILRIGYAWSAGEFCGKTLVNEARSVMHCKKTVPPSEHIFLKQKDDILYTKPSVSLKQYTIYLQPKIHMGTGELLGAEALVRGIDEAGNHIMPEKFIKKLEKTGDIRDMDLHVLECTLAQMDHWCQKGIKPIPISVNFSRMTLFNPSSLASVLAIQSRYPYVSSGLLEIEITERTGHIDSHVFADVVNRFRELGIRFSLDDFGSEYANFSIFTNVRFDYVKLDRSLISDLVHNPKGQMLVRDLIKICHNCGMLCVAEGVENASQAAILTEAGCVCGQGYYYDPPLPVEQFEKKYLHPAVTNVRK